MREVAEVLPADEMVEPDPLAELRDPVAAERLVSHDGAFVEQEAQEALAVPIGVEALFAEDPVEGVVLGEGAPRAIRRVMSGTSFSYVSAYNGLANRRLQPLGHVSGAVFSRFSPPTASEHSANWYGIGTGWHRITSHLHRRASPPRWHRPPPRPC